MSGLSGDAPELLSDDDTEEGRKPARTPPPPAPALGGLRDFFDEVTGFRKRQGKRCSLSRFLTIAVAARMAGCRGVPAFAGFAKLPAGRRKEAVGAFWSPGHQCWTVPPEPAFRYIFPDLDPDALDSALRERAAHAGDGGPVAMDGKDVRGASKRPGEGRLMTVAAGGHGSGMALGQTRTPEKPNGITAVRELSRTAGLSGRTVTLDALRAQQETARILVDECGADHAVTSVKGNQPTIRDGLKGLDWNGGQCHETLEKGHGRPGSRRCTVADLSGRDGVHRLHGRRQAIRMERRTGILKTGAVSGETSCCLTSLGPAQADARRLSGPVRGHWTIGNRNRYARGFTCDGDRCRVRAGHTPRNPPA